MWPPDYTIKKQLRARHIKLKASLEKGLELIVPSHFNIKHAPDILLKNRAWIEKRLLELREKKIARDQCTVPDVIDLVAIQQSWRIQKIETNMKLTLRIRPQFQELVLMGKVDNQARGKKLLIDWIKAQAKIHLSEKLKQVSAAIRLPYQKMTIRDQKTRWGSCSKNKSINLNYKIIFLPQPLATHILIHELCHTVHLNHSEKFWQLVESFDPNYQQHRKAVRRVDQFIPVWL